MGKFSNMFSIDIDAYRTKLSKAISETVKLPGVSKVTYYPAQGKDVDYVVFRSDEKGYAFKATLFPNKESSVDLQSYKLNTRGIFTPVDVFPIMVPSFDIKKDVDRFRNLMISFLDKWRDA